MKESLCAPRPSPPPAPACTSACSQKMASQCLCDAEGDERYGGCCTEFDCSGPHTCHMIKKFS